MSCALHTTATVASSNFFDTLGSLTSANFSAIISQVQQILPRRPTSEPPPDTWQDIFNAYTTGFSTFLAGRSALENTSLLLALVTFLILGMSWTSRFGKSLGQFSPFTRSPPSGSAKVSDADFSYITADDLREHHADQGSARQQRPDSPVDHGPPRDTDVLVLRNKRKDYHVHFPAYSISRGELLVGQVRDQAAKKVGTVDSRRTRGLRDGAELLLTIADPASTDASEDDDDEELGYDEQTGDGEPRKRRNRGKKSKKRNKREEQQTRQQQESGTSTPTLQPPPSQNSRAPSPKPTTPMGKLNELREKLGEFLPQVEAYKRNPPAEKAKREFEHKRLSETILTQVLLKLDGVETEGDPDARAKRKELVKETQAMLADVDAVAKL
ncbi:BCL2-associated athanogene-like protein [Teratosphaeria destructans]|uniref:BCL2-associated athanogene-like protein n=1 Tax=Teratosphaeria destructans TaxID=418781 RepID=A0A9W7SSB9_9PEZI|nr:BCL2-associated athanogene-like protein [Teratosphaeria destructans]